MFGTGDAFFHQQMEGSRRYLFFASDQRNKFVHGGRQTEKHPSGKMSVFTAAYIHKWSTGEVCQASRTIWSQLLRVMSFAESTESLKD